MTKIFSIFLLCIILDDSAVVVSYGFLCRPKTPINLSYNIAFRELQNGVRSHFFRYSAQDDKIPSDEKNIWTKAINFFSRKDLMTADNLKKFGTSVLLSYGIVSNINYSTAVIIAWCIHGKTSGLSPLAPGQWKGFLAIYAGLWAANNFLRPARVSLSIIISPWLQKLVDKIESYSKLNKAQSAFLTFIIVNNFGAICYLVLGLTLVTRLLGLPLLP